MGSYLPFNLYLITDPEAKGPGRSQYIGGRKSKEDVLERVGKLLNNPDALTLYQGVYKWATHLVVVDGVLNEPSSRILAIAEIGVDTEVKPLTEMSDTTSAQVEDAP